MKISREQVRSAKARVVAWLTEHVVHTDPFTWATSAERAFRRKCFNELSFYLLFADAAGRSTDPALAGLRLFVEAGINDDYVSLAARSAESLPLHGIALAYGARTGCLKPGSLRFVRELLSSAFAWGQGGSTLSRLELAAVCHLAGARPAIAQDIIFKSSPLAIPPSCIHGKKDAYYALTHAAFYKFLMSVFPDDACLPLDTSLHGGLCRCVAQENMDLGMELVAASLLLGRPLEAAALMVVETAVTQILADGLVKPPYTSALAAGFAADVPEQSGWAMHFHVMLVAGITLTLLDDYVDAYPLEVSTRERDVVMRLGRGLDALGDNQLIRGLREIGSPHGISDRYQSILEEIRRFILFSRCPDGHYGHVVDELALARRLSQGRSNTAALRAQVDTACEDFLHERHPCETGENETEPL